MEKNGVAIAQINSSLILWIAIDENRLNLATEAEPLPTIISPPLFFSTFFFFC